MKPLPELLRTTWSPLPKLLFTANIDLLERVRQIERLPNWRFSLDPIFDGVPCTRASLLAEKALTE